MSNWFLDKLTSSSFDENVDVAKRHDGNFNLWRRVISFTKKDGFSSFWEVIGVFSSETEANDAREKLRSSLS